MVSVDRSVRAAFAVSALALVVGVAPSLAASPIGDWKLKGNFNNAAGSQPKIAAANPYGSFVVRTITGGGGPRDVWFNGDGGNGGLGPHVSEEVVVAPAAGNDDRSFRRIGLDLEGEARVVFDLAAEAG